MTAVCPADIHGEIRLPRAAVVTGQYTPHLVRSAAGPGGGHRSVQSPRHLKAESSAASGWTAANAFETSSELGTEKPDAARSDGVDHATRRDCRVRVAETVRARRGRRGRGRLAANKSP